MLILSGEQTSGFRQWRWKGMDFSAVSTPTDLAAWMDLVVDGPTAPEGVREAIGKLDQLSHEMRAPPSVTGLHQNRFRHEFGIGMPTNELRLRKAVLSAWQVSNLFTDAFVQRLADAKSTPATSRKLLESIGQVRFDAFAMIQTLERWKPEAHATRASLEGALDVFIALVEEAKAWADIQIPKRGSAASNCVRDHEPWLSDKETETGNGELEFDDSGTVNIDLLNLRRTKSGNPKLFGATAIVDAWPPSGEEIEEDRLDNEGQRGRPGLVDKAHRPDRFLILRLAEIYAVNFGRRPPLHNSAAAGAQPYADERFGDFVRTAFDCFRWPRDTHNVKRPSDVENDLRSGAGLDDTLRGIGQSGPPHYFRRRLHALADNTVLEYGALPSLGLLQDMLLLENAEL